MTLSPDQIRVDSSAWELYEETPEYRRYRMELEPGKFIIRTDYLAEDELLEDNKRLLNESDGKRWGDGQVAARIPLNVFYQQFAPRLKEGDEDFAKWFLNNDKYRAYRTFKGRV